MTIENNYFMDRWKVFRMLFRKREKENVIEKRSNIASD